jgi:hypothetical protein
LRFRFPDDDRRPQTSAVQSILYGVCVGLATAAVCDVVDILLGCTNPSVVITAVAYPQFLPMFGMLPALLGAVGSAALDGWLTQRMGLRAGRVVMFLVIATLSVVFMLTGIEGKQTC